MVDWLKKFLYDTSVKTASTVVGAIILSALAWLWSQSSFSFNPATAWAVAMSTLRGYWGVLTVPVGVPRILFYPFLVIAGVVFFIVVVLLYSPGEQVKAPPLNMTDNHRKILRMLYDMYAEGLLVNEVAAQLGMKLPAAEALIHELMSAELVTFVPAHYGPGFLRLSIPGRDYCHQHGLDK